MSHPRISWDMYFMSTAMLTAMRSPDPSTQVGAVIVGPDQVIRSMGYNGWPRGVPPFEADDPRWQRPEKYNWMAHGEENAILNAGRIGAALNGCRLYVPIFPCANCARLIIQSGITEVITHRQATEAFIQGMGDSQGWVKGLETSRHMLELAGVQLRELEGDMPEWVLRFSGQEFDLGSHMPL